MQQSILFPKNKRGDFAHFPFGICARDSCLVYEEMYSLSIISNYLTLKYRN